MATAYEGFFGSAQKLSGRGRRAAACAHDFEPQRRSAPQMKIMEEIGYLPIDR
jgi:hypothetical protein